MECSSGRDEIQSPGHHTVKLGLCEYLELERWFPARGRSHYFSVGCCLNPGDRRLLIQGAHGVLGKDGTLQFSIRNMKEREREREGERE